MDNTGFRNIISGLEQIGFSSNEIKKIAGENWMNFFDKSFGYISR
jgi:microsomal dipeptidase-like Zn-dependent dipeptidase